MAPNVFFFDIEAGGLSAHQSPLLSLSWQMDHEKGDFFAKPTEGTNISHWAREVVLKDINERTATSSLQSEKEVIEQFIAKISSLPKGSTITGWNIGYEAAPQVLGTTPGFDLPFLAQRAEGYGLLGKFQEALAPHKTVDLAQEYIYKMSSELPRYEGLVEKGLLDKDIFAQMTGYTKKGEYLEAIGEAFTPEEMGRRSIKTTGWKQEMLSEMMGYGAYKAHTVEDVQAGMRLFQGYAEGAPVFKTEADVVKWGRMALRNKLVSSVMSPQMGQDPATHFSETIARATEAERAGGSAYTGFVKEVESAMVERAKTKGGTLEQLKLGRGIKEQMYKVGAGGEIFDSTKIFKRFTNEVSGWANKNPGLALGIGAFGLYLGAKVLFGNPFSAKDDNYNTIEGLKHGGLAEESRLQFSDFGSGWRGLIKVPISLSSSFNMAMKGEQYGQRILGSMVTKGQADDFLVGMEQAVAKNLENVKPGSVLESEMFKDFSSFKDEVMRATGDLGSTTIVDPIAVRMYANSMAKKVGGVTDEAAKNALYSATLKDTIRHERLHQYFQKTGVAQQWNQMDIDTSGWTSKIADWYEQYNAPIGGRASNIFKEEFLLAAAHNNTMLGQMKHMNPDNAAHVLKTSEQFADVSEDMLSAMKMSSTRYMHLHGLSLKNVPQMFNEPMQARAVFKKAARQQLNYEATRQMWNYGNNAGKRHVSKKPR